MELHGQLVNVARTVSHQSEVVAIGIAIALGKAEKAATKRVVRQLEQWKQVSGAIRQWRAGQAMDDGVAHRGLQYFLCSPAPLTGVILQIVSLVEHNSGEWQSRELFKVPLQNVVVDDHPSAESKFGDGRRAADHNDLDMVLEHEKKAINHKQLVQSLKEVNRMIQKASDLRVGAAKANLVTSCRAAICSNNVLSLFKILKMGSTS